MIEILDHKDHILGQITRQADRAAQKLKQEHAKQLAAMKKDIDAKTRQKLKDLKHEHDKTMRRTQRRHDSTRDLLESQLTLEKQSHLIGEVRTRLLKDIQGKERERIVAIMVERLRAQGGTSFVVPKEISLPDCTPNHDELMVTAVISDNEELEIHLQDLLHEHHKEMHDIIAKELFP